MKEKPRNPKEPLFDKNLFEEIAVSGLVIGMLVFALWYFLIKGINMNVMTARGYIMALMVFIQNIHVFNCRSEKKSAFTVSLKSNILIVVAFLSSVILQIIVMEVPVLSKFLQTTSISFDNLLYLFVLASMVLIVIEVYKKIKYSEKNK
jgi:magnesium-transporting ATPase (P-type)